MFTEDIAEKVLMNPLREERMNSMWRHHTQLTRCCHGFNELGVHQHQTLRIAMMIGMVPYNYLSVTVHDGFCALVRPPYPPQVERVECSYLYDYPAFHGNLYVWKKNGELLRHLWGLHLSFRVHLLNIMFRRA